MKKLSLIICLILMLGSQVFATNAVIPLFFHSATTNLSTQDVYNLVCDLNRNYYYENGVAVTWYVGGIDNSPTAHTNWDNGGVNVYIGPTSSWPGGYKVNLALIDGSDGLTHELGHLMSLPHPAPPILGNWMSQGQFYPGTFTNAQKTAIDNYTVSANMLPGQYKNYINFFPQGSVLTTSAGYNIPVAKLELIAESAQVNFLFDSGCPTAQDPTSIDYEVHTFCEGREKVIHGTINNYSSPTIIPKCWGIEFIVYTYRFGPYSHSVTIYYGNIYPPQFPAEGCACTAVPPDEDSKPGRDDEPSGVGSTIREKDHIDIFVNEKLNYNNGKFETAYIYDLSGKIIMTSKLNPGSGTIDISSLSKGLYIFKAIDGKGQVQVTKFFR